MRVLITDGNERSALAVTRALGQQQLQVVVGSEMTRSLAATSKYCWQSFSYPSPYTEAQGFVSRLLDSIKCYQITTVFPMSDIATQLIGQSRKEFEACTIVPIPPIEVFAYLSDKYRLMQLATNLGVPIPDTVFIPGGNVEAAIDGIRHFPVVVKPARSLMYLNGQWRKTSVHYAANATELRRLYRDVDYLQQPSLIQRRIEGEGQGLFVLFNQGNPVVLFAHRRLREKPPAGGVSVLRESIALPQPMTEYAMRLLQHVGWHGVAMVEFKVERQSGIPLLMEVNGRFWGSLQLAIDAGLNIPYLLYQVATGQETKRSVDRYRIGIKTRWLLGDVDHLMARLLKPGIALNLPTNSPSKLQTLLAFCRFFQRGMYYEVLRLNDLKPFVYELQQYFRDLLCPTMSQGKAR